MVDQIIILIVGATLLAIILIWILLRAIKKRKAKKKLEKEIPREVEKDFNEIERRWASEIQNGNNNPYSVLWQYSKDRRFGSEGTANNRITNTIAGSPIANSANGMDERIEERRELPSRIDLGNKPRVEGTPGVKRSSNTNNFFSKFKRK